MKELNLAQTIEGLDVITSALEMSLVAREAEHLSIILGNVRRYLGMISEVTYDTWADIERRLPPPEHRKPEGKVVQLRRRDTSC